MSKPEIYSADYYDAMRGDPNSESDAHLALYAKFLHLVEPMLDRPLKILDAGCGRGDFLKLLSKKEQSDLWGVDFSAVAVELSQKNLQSTMGDTASQQIKQGSLDDPTLFETGTFDLIAMTDVVEHLPPPVLERAIANTTAWLKPGGKLFIHTFPTLGPHRLYESILKLRRRYDLIEKINTIHCNVQTRKRLKRVLAQPGLVLDKIWIDNDFTLTSSTYQEMSNGFIKSSIGFMIDHVLASRFVSACFDVIGLGEFARPSIYAYCHKTN